MILVINTVCFYAFISNYYTWFKNIDSQYMAYCNSTISSILVLTTEKFGGTIIACQFLGGFLIYDMGHILLNLELYKKNYTYANYIVHHIITLSLCLSQLPNIYPSIASDLLNLETTVPIGNLIWFSSRHHIEKDYSTGLKLLYFALFSYYRIYKLINLSINNINIDSYYGILFLLLLTALNISWYVKLIKKNITLYL